MSSLSMMIPTFAMRFRIYSKPSISTPALFATASEFLASKRPQGPCCVVVDVRLPGLSGLDFQQQLARENIPIPVIFITGHGDIPMSVRAMKAGAVEFLTKPLRDQDLLDAIQAALRRDRARLEEEQGVAELRTRHKSLTAREREVMALLVSGRVNKQIAAEIGISEVTVRLHRGQVMRKMRAEFAGRFDPARRQNPILTAGGASLPNN